MPVYNSYILFKVTWETKFFWISLGLSIVSGLLNGMNADGGNMAFSAIATIISLAIVVIGVILFHKLSKAFGHGIGFTVGLCLLNPIFMLILAFGNSEYKGANQ